VKYVLFLGAGFSRAFGFPTMNEFFEHARSSLLIDDKDKTFLTKLRAATRSGASMLKGSEVNLEHVLSFAIMAPDLQGDERGQGIDEHLRHVLFKLFRPIDHAAVKRWRDRFRHMLYGEDGSGGDHQNSLAIITTNYDILVDHLLFLIQRPAHLVTPWKPVDQTAASKLPGLYAQSAQSPKLFKLHGAINWYVDDNERDHMIVEARVMNGNMTDREGNISYVSIPATQSTDFSPPSPPLIVPPTFFKHQPDRRLQSTWTAAGEVLRHADRVGFVGYSFPESDTQMRYFLGAALAQNIDLQAIDLVDPNANAIMTHLGSKVFGDHFMHLLRPIAECWESNRYTVRGTT
jgi:hypothetical protein